MDPDLHILGIDPGTTSSAFLFWSPHKEVVDEKGIFDNNDLLILLRQVGEDPKTPLIVAIEDIECFGMAVGVTVFDTVRFTGRLQEICEYYEMPCTFVKRSAVKMHLCHNPRAKDPNVRQALIDRFGLPGTKKEPGHLYGVKTHLWSALSVAVTHGDKIKNPLGRES